MSDKGWWEKLDRDVPAAAPVRPGQISWPWFVVLPLWIVAGWAILSIGYVVVWELRLWSLGEAVGESVDRFERTFERPR